MNTYKLKQTTITVIDCMEDSIIGILDFAGDNYIDHDKFGITIKCSNNTLLRQRYDGKLAKTEDGDIFKIDDDTLSRYYEKIENKIDIYKTKTRTITVIECTEKNIDDIIEFTGDNYIDHGSFGIIIRCYKILVEINRYGIKLAKNEEGHIYEITDDILNQHYEKIKE